MAIKKVPSLNPLSLGQEQEIVNATRTAAGSEEIQFLVKADTVLFSLQASVVSGDLNIVVYTEGDENDSVGNRVAIITFPTISAPTSELLLRKASATMQKIRVVVTYTGACTFIMRARGTATGEASFKILGNNDLRMSQIDVTTTPVAIIPAGLTDRASVAIKNYNTTGVLFLGGTAAESLSSVGWPVGPQESYVVDVAAGQEIYGRSDSGTIDVRISETGG